MLYSLWHIGKLMFVKSQVHIPTSFNELSYNKGPVLASSTMSAVGIAHGTISINAKHIVTVWLTVVFVVTHGSFSFTTLIKTHWHIQSPNNERTALNVGTT